MSKNKDTGTRNRMISAAMAKALSGQVTNEMNAAHTYLAMAYRFDAMGYKIFARRFMAQSEEERGHAVKIAHFIQEVGGEVEIGAVAKPRSDYDSVESIVEAAVESELRVTKQINDLVSQSDRENDYATRSFLQWFVDEQVEEVSSMSDLLQLVRLAGERNLFQVEGRLAQAMAAKN